MRPDTSHWREESAYDFMEQAGVDNLAWECLRRNGDYQQDYRVLRGAGSLDQRLPEPMERRWGYDFAARPRLSGFDQPVLWSDTVDTAVLRLAGSLVPPREGSATLRAFLSGEVRITPAELHLLMREVGPGLHLVADPTIQPDDPLAISIPIDPDSLDRLAAADRLLRHLAGYRVPRDQRMTAQQRRRLKAMLRAVDARRHRASQREIAQVLFGVDRIDEEQWQSSPFRDTVRDLLRDGATMIAGGYLKLLRFRRRS